LEGLRAEALAARRDGFLGKLAVDAAQAAVINEIFARRAAPAAGNGA
jgi:citrate lyase subunit beta/citryl-CoA lyase